MPESNKEIVRRLYEEVFETGQLDVADALVAADCRDLGDPRDRQGPARVMEVASMLRAAFPDLHWEILDLIAENDQVVMHSAISGTHSGPFMGMPATGKTFADVHHVYIFRLRDGKIAEHRAVRDDVAQMRQLGLIPNPTNHAETS